MPPKQKKVEKNGPPSGSTPSSNLSVVPSSLSTMPTTTLAEGTQNQKVRKQKKKTQKEPTYVDVGAAANDVLSQYYSQPRYIPADYEHLIPEMSRERILRDEVILSDPIRRYDENHEKEIVRTFFYAMFWNLK